MKLGLFLIEQILAILVFAVAAAICVQLFANAYLQSRANGELNYALLTAQNGAEAFKAAHGDWQATADILDDRVETIDGKATICLTYDSNWQTVDDANAAYIMELSAANTATPGLNQADITIREANATSDKTIYELLVTARRAI